jgi:hypothetical protein
MVDVGWLQSVISGAAGGALTLVGQWLNCRWSRSAQREARSHEQAAARQTRREAFELDLLEDLESATYLPWAEVSDRQAACTKTPCNGPSALALSFPRIRGRLT